MVTSEFQGNIVLIGFMGTGKTTVSEYFRDVYGMEMVDMDWEIARQEGMSIPNIFAEKGEDYFRNLETELLKVLSRKRNLIISCGGGAVLRGENVEIMKENGKVVLLTASPEVILERVQSDEDRPVLKGRKTVEGIRELMNLRREKYEAAADFTIDTDRKKVREICEEILIQLKGRGK